ncbi:MAG: response regulator [Deltaproteobacteria bacterium]|nr:response regulator [Deltaproteobacteria bacterium]
MPSIEDTPGIKILVVDDDPSVGRMIADFISGEGYPMVLCNDPEQALELMGKEAFDLAFLDINMPHMNGLELASRLKERLPLCEVVFITGFGSFDNAIQAIKLGAYDYLRKPFGINELRLCIKRFQERQELKEKIRLAEQKYFRLVQDMPSMVFSIRKDFKLEFINRAVETMLGFPSAEAMDDPEWFLGRLHPDDHRRMKELFLKAFQSRYSSFSAECRLIHRDGHTLHVMMGSIARSITEKTAGADIIQGMIVDISDRVFSEKAVIQREKLKLLSSISAEVAHGIRNPLVSIGGFARRLRKRFKDLPEGDIILSESERLEKLVNRIAEYLRPVEVTYRDCSINNVLKGCVNSIAPELEAKNMRCNLRLATSLPVISIDRDILSRIFTDLIRNAEREMEPGGELDIMNYESDNNHHIEFKSTCLKKRERGKDMEPFFLPFSSEHESGLAISYRLLKDMGGLLTYSQAERETTFTVSLPKKEFASTDTNGEKSLPAA